MITGAEPVTWNLDLLYATLKDPKIEQDLSALKSRTEAFVSRYYGSFLSKETVTEQLALEALEAYEKILDIAGRLGMMAYLSFAQDTQDHEAKIFLAKAQDMEAELKNQLLFLELELTQLEEEAFQKLAQAQSLQNYRHFFQTIAQKRSHMLSEKEEKLVNWKNLTGSEAFVKMYEELCSSFSFRFERDGKEELLNMEQVRELRHDPDESVRLQACRALFHKAKDHALIVEHTFNSIIKDYGVEAKLRGFSTPRSWRNLHNEISDATVSTLVEVTTRNNSLVQDYYRLKTRMMGKDRLQLSDMYAPITPVRTTYTWDQAKNIVLDTFNRFDPRFSQIAQGFFDQRRIDARVHPAKQGGAFCAYISPTQPVYVLMQYMGGIDNILTLAHELGHGIHGTLSQQQSLLNYDTPLTTAEIASVFGEMLVTDALLEKMEGKALQSLICTTLEGMFATMHRQNMFSRFEERAHQAIAKAYLPFEGFSDIYWEELQKVFGDSLEINPEFRWEWAFISHFLHTPFYVYAYNFAQLLVIALYQRYLEMGPSFKPLFIGLLEKGGSLSPEELLKPLGIDLQDPNFWQGGFDYIRAQLLDRLEKSVDGE